MKRSYQAFSWLSMVFFLSTCFAGTIELQDVPETKLKQGTVRQVLQGSNEKIWATITDVGHYDQFMPKNKKSTILESSPDRIRYRAVVDMPWPISDVQYGCDFYPMRDLNRIEFNMVEGTGKGVKTFYGHWDLKKLSNTETNATYVLVFQSSKNYPRWAMNKGLKSTLGQVMESVQTRVNGAKKN